MALDYSKLSDEELEAIANNDYTKLSDNTLKAIANEPSASRPAQKTSTELNAAQVVAPAVTGYGIQPTGLGQLGQDVWAVTKPLATSIAEGASNVANVYKAHPIAAPLADVVGMSTVGIPPVATSQGALGAYDKWKAIEAGKNIASQTLSQGAPTETPVRGLPTTTTKGPYMEMIKAAGPELGAQISQTYGAQTGGGGNNAVRSFLNSAEGRAAQAANPEFAAKAAQYLEAVPGYGQQAMKIVSPIARGAARVAGPAGMAYNLYEAGQMARETELGQRLAQGQGQLAEQAFRQGPVQTYQGPQLSPYEAQNVLRSGSKRDIDYFGGADRLNMMIRLQAAKKVLGQ